VSGRDVSSPLFFFFPSPIVADGPSHRYDLIWTIRGSKLISITRQDCPELEEDSKNPFLLIQ
jgi:hypothetical protein